MALCLKYSVLAHRHSENILFRTMLTNSVGLFVTNDITSHLLYLESDALTSQVYTSSAVLQLNKVIRKLWRYDALQWHTFTTKLREYH
jgi:hypothetical protein